MKTIAIIGTAGRKTDRYKLNAKIYKQMIEKTKDLIENHFKLNPTEITLISGGAAWSDHIAVELYLSDYAKSAKLYLPCDWSDGKYAQTDNAGVGQTANYYHSLFSKQIKRDTLQDIDTSINKGLQINTDFKGFKPRNSEVAKSDYIIAFTFSSTDVPADGGTLDTWKKSASVNKIHVSLASLNSS